jgi:hypothetical protein
LNDYKDKNMTADERLTLIRVKIERAKHHLRALEVVRQDFIKGNAYRIECETNQTGFNIYRVFNLQAPPVEIGLAAGDVIHNLRSSLDHLAYQLVYANGATHSKQTAFPIWDSAAEYKAQGARRVKGMAQDAIDAIDAIEPYQGGKGAGLWVLHYLDIADKHHALLTPLINVTEASFTIPGFWERNYEGVGGVSFPNFGKPLKDGDVAATREATMDKDMNITLDVAFTEPDVIEGRPVVETLQRLVDFVDDRILSFKPFLG